MDGLVGLRLESGLGLGLGLGLGRGLGLGFQLVTRNGRPSERGRSEVALAGPRSARAYDLGSTGLGLGLGPGVRVRVRVRG